MDVATIAKLVGVILTVIGIWKILYELKIGRKSQLRAEYEFAKKFLFQIETENIHPYALEKGYQAIAGSTVVKASEIEYILTLEDPVQCLKDYVLSKQLMEKMETTGNLKLTFKSKYSGNWSRNWRKVMYLSFYFIFALIALSPFIIQSFINTSAPNMVVQLLFTIPFGGLYALAALNAFLKIARGELLIQNQNRYTKNIILES